MAKLTMQEEASAPSTPASGKWVLYFKSGGLYIKDDAGNEIGPIAVGTTDHGALTGLSDDDHAQYLLASGLREWDQQGSDPSSPATSKWKLYFKSDGLYTKNNAGTVSGPLGTGSGGGGDVIRTKYIITPSVASNNLTVAIKYIDGTDPSSTNKLTFRVGNTEYDLTASMSFTKNAGTNWCNAGSNELKTKNVQFFLYAIGETGASAGLKFGFSRIPYAKTMADFVNTTTNEKYIAGNWTNFNSTDAVVNIGRFQAQNSGTASYNWSIPTANVVNYPIYETDILTWQPSYSANGSMTYTPVTTFVAEYRVSGRDCSFELQAIGTIGGTVNRTVLATLPFEARNAAAQPAQACWVVADTVAEVSFAYINASTPDQLGCRRTNSSNWVAGDNKYINCNGKYVTA